MTMLQIFHTHDVPYLAWLARHLNGYVLNTRRAFDPSYLVLHRATCRTIGRPNRATHPDPFTGNNYIKVCSTRVGDLLGWIFRKGGGGFSRRCLICRPAAKDPD